MTISASEFTPRLYSVLQQITPAVAEMELYEFQYALNNILPEGGWDTVTLETTAQIESYIHDVAFFKSIELKPRLDGKIVLDRRALHLTHMLLAGLASGAYRPEWVSRLFYFDIRGFYFLVRIEYLTPAVRAHLGGQPYRQFEPLQAGLAKRLEIGYKEFKQANAEIDAAFIQTVLKLIAARGTPIVLAIAGPTAAGKTEIVERLCAEFERAGQKVATIEMDNFLTDRDYREEHGIGTLGAQAIHFELFKTCLNDIIAGRKISIPRYDFINATSSHDLNGQLKPDGKPIEIEPADIIFMEGNFPFLIQEIAALIGIKVVYLTADDVRLKRKWRRDMDYRKKYDHFYLCNRYFKDQFLMAQTCYLPQLAACDIFVDTSAAALWLTPETAARLA